VDKLKSKDWVVRDVGISTARNIVEAFHYSGGATNTRVYTHGLFKKGEDFFDNQCLGVAWWLPPTKNAAIATYDGDWRKVLSLTRLAINPEVPSNAASFLLGASIRMIKKIGNWDCLVTYADTWRNHTGAIYKATNWEYMGETKPSLVMVNQDGRMMGRKRGGRNLTKQEMIDAGFKNIGSYPKHKFRIILHRGQ